MAYGTKVQESVYASGQPSETEFRELVAGHFQRIIDLRPPAEDRGFDEAAEAVARSLNYFNLPIAGEADFTPANLAKFDQLLSDRSAPRTLVHCASGNRVGALFALRGAWLKGANLEDAIALGRLAGLRGMEGAVRTAIAKGLPEN
ncbi:MAG: sulfur transferase domain-containing protein [Gammaproteobacteria bacterium]